MYNMLSIDVEDTFQYLYRDSRGKQTAPTDQVVESTLDILNILGEHKTRATFFVLGIVAEHFPDLVRQIAEAGHEIATHGYSHRFITHMTPQEFASELHHSITLLEKASGQKVIGHRAPAFAVGKGNAWVFELLAEQGIRYDSSVVPQKTDTYKRLGAVMAPFKIKEEVIEAPLSVQYIGRTRILLGGTYFRLFPYLVLKQMVQRLNRVEIPAVVYLHPYEFDSYHFKPVAKSVIYHGAPLKQRLETEVHRFQRKLNRQQTKIKLKRLLTEFRFTSMQEGLTALGMSL